MKKWIIIASFLMIIILGYIFKLDLKSIRAYSPNGSNIKGAVDAEYFSNISGDFEIGANIYGYAVFKNPDKAYKTLLKMYADGIELIKKEYSLPDISKSEYSSYLIYGWQVTTGSIEQQEQARFVAQFLDIYENSYVRE